MPLLRGALAAQDDLGDQTITASNIYNKAMNVYAAGGQASFLDDLRDALFGVHSVHLVHKALSFAAGDSLGA